MNTPGPAILSIVNIETGSEREIQPKLASMIGGFHWTHDGRFLLVAVRNDKNEKDRQGIYKIDAQTGETNLVIAAPEGTWIHLPISSRDGKSLFYLSSKGAIMVRNLETGEDRMVFEARKENDPRAQPFLLSDLTLSPDGQWLAFKYRKPDHGYLMVMSAQGGEVRDLFHESSRERINDARGIAWTPDGRYLLFAMRNSPSDPFQLWRIPTEGGKPQNLEFARPELSNLSIHPDGRRIAFAAGQTVNREVWVMENFLPKDEKITKYTTPLTRQVWAGPDVDTFGSPSADGRYLAATDWDTGDLAIRDLVAGHTRRLTNKGSWVQSFEYALFPVLSPDGKQVAYGWFNKDWDWDLRIMGTDGSAPRVLYHGTSKNDEFVLPVGWTPDGKHLAVGITKGKSFEIGFISLTDGSFSPLKSINRSIFAGSIRLSPDGRYIAYDMRQKPDSDNDIFLLDVETKQESPLVQHPAYDFAPTWTPDGKSILFVSDRTGTPGFWLQPVLEGKPNGKAELLKGDLGSVWPMGFTRNGVLYYAHETGMNDVFMASIDFKSGKVLEAPTPVSQRYVGSNSTPVWSPDGKYLAYVSQRGPKNRIGLPRDKVLVIRSLDTGQERDVTVNLATISSPQWSPDGHSILAYGEEAYGGAGIYRIDTQTGAATVVVQGEGNVLYRWPTLTRDEKKLLYFRMDFSRKTHSIRMRDIESGREKELYSVNPPANKIESMGLSPDGQQLAFILFDSQKPQQATLKVMPVSGGNAREICQIPVNVTEPSRLIWTPDGERILFLRQDPGKSLVELWHVSAAGGEPQRLGLSMDHLRELSLHPDGQRVVFAAGESKPEVWVMENFLPKENTQSRRVVSGKR